MISPQAVSRWEQDENMPDVDNILRLSKIFDVSTDYLLKNGETLRAGGEKTDDEDDEKGFSFSVGLEGLESLKELKNLKELKELKNLDNDGNIVIRNGKVVHVDKHKPRNFFIKNINRIAVLSFLIVGLGWSMWHPGWIILAAAWAIKTIYNVATTKSLESVGFGGLAIIIFFVMGFGWRLWHPGWLVFLVAGLLDSLVNDYRRNKHYGDEDWDDDDDD